MPDRLRSALAIVPGAASVYPDVETTSPLFLIRVQLGTYHMELKTLLNGSSKVFYTVAEVASQFGICHKSVYRLLDRGQLTSSPALRRKMIPRASIEKFITSSLQGGVR